MTKYANYSGKSSIDSYLISEYSIKVKFKNNRTIYVYSVMQNGHHIAEMKQRAKNSSGLGGYIAKRKKILEFTKEN